MPKESIRFRPRVESIRFKPLVIEAGFVVSYKGYANEIKEAPDANGKVLLKALHNGELKKVHRSLIEIIDHPPKEEGTGEGLR